MGERSERTCLQRRTKEPRQVKAAPRHWSRRAHSMRTASWQETRVGLDGAGVGGTALPHDQPSRSRVPAQSRIRPRGLNNSRDRQRLRRGLSHRLDTRDVTRPERNEAPRPPTWTDPADLPPSEGPRLTDSVYSVSAAGQSAETECTAGLPGAGGARGVTVAGAGPLWADDVLASDGGSGHTWE